MTSTDGACRQILFVYYSHPYVALAARLDAPLITTDHRLARPETVARAGEPVP